MKKNLMAILTASSVAVMAMGATLAVYADLVFEENGPEVYARDEAGTYEFNLYGGELKILKSEGFDNWRAGLEEISSNSDYNWFTTYNRFKKVSFSDEITEIPAHAFEGLTNLYDVELGENVTEIGERAFAGCTNLGRTENLETRPGSGEWVSQPHSVSLDYALTTIGESSFEGCTGIMDITIPENVTEIGKRAFADCTSLGMAEESEYLNDSNITEITYLVHRLDFASDCKIKCIGEGAFSGCTSILQVNFPNHIETIDKRAFEGCTSLFEVNLEYCYSLKTIEELAFFNCISLTKVVFPCNGVKDMYKPYTESEPSKYTIKKGAFRNCSWLENVFLSYNVGLVEDGAFYKCKNLKYIGYPNRLIDYGDNCYYIDAEVKLGKYSTQDEAVESVTPDENVTDKAIIYAPPEVTVFAFDQLDYDEVSQMADEVSQMAEEKAGDKPEDNTSDEYAEWENRYNELVSNLTNNLNGKHRIYIKQTSKDGTNYIPEKIYMDGDIGIFKSTPNDIILDVEMGYACPECGKELEVDEWGYATCYDHEWWIDGKPYYNFTEPDGYKMIVNVLSGTTSYDVPFRTPRSAADVMEPTSVFGSDCIVINTSGGYVIKMKNPDDNSSTPEESSDSSSESESSDSSSEPTSSEPTSSDPPPYVPPINDDDPVEPDPDSSDDSSEPESSEPDSSNSEDESNASKPTDVPHSNSDSVGSVPNPPDNNPNTGVRLFAPAIFAGAAIVVVAVRRRKMK